MCFLTGQDMTFVLIIILIPGLLHTIIYLPTLMLDGEVKYLEVVVQHSIIQIKAQYFGIYIIVLESR